MNVTSVLQEYFRSLQECDVMLTGELQLCQRKATSVFQQRYKGVSVPGMLQECYKSVLGVFQECHKSVLGVVPSPQVTHRRPGPVERVLSIRIWPLRIAPGPPHPPPPGVTVVSQWCHSDVTVVLQWCHSGVTVVLQWCYSGVTVVLPVPLILPLLRRS
jgi:hypothetical protein